MKNVHFLVIRKATMIIILALILLPITTIVFAHFANQYKNIPSSTIPEKTHEQLLEELSFYFLYPYIQDALTEYYGKPKQYWQEKIDIKKVEIDYRYFLEITVQVETFEGAHNPPRGRDTITFRTKEYSISVKLINYKHEDI